MVYLLTTANNMSTLLKFAIVLLLLFKIQYKVIFFLIHLTNKFQNFISYTKTMTNTQIKTQTGNKK